MTSFISMGGYASFVWPAYIVAVVVMIGLLLASLQGMRARERELKVLQELRPHRGRGGQTAATQAKNAEESTGADA